MTFVLFAITLFLAPIYVAALCLLAARCARLPGGDLSIRDEASILDPVLANPPRVGPGPALSDDEAPTERWSRVTGTINVTRLGPRTLEVVETRAVAP